MRALVLGLALLVPSAAFVVATARGPQGDLEQVLPFSRGVPYAFTNPVFIERVER